MRYLVALPLLLHVLALASPSLAQVTLSASSFQTGATASTPSCTDPGTGGPSIPVGTASCTGPPGYTAVSMASASLVADATGGMLAASTQVAATAPGGLPAQTSNGNAFATSFASWSVTGSVHYSVAVTGDLIATIQGNGGVTLPPSGVLPASESLTVSLNPNDFAVASDSGPLSAAASSAGEAEVTFAPVGASDLIMGTVLAGGNAMAGLLVEALVTGTPIASTQTASDGSYLLTGIGVPVTLRLSDPAGDFVTELSPLLTAPATYDADLDPVPTAPGLGLPAAAILSLTLGKFGSRMTATSSRRS